MGGAEDNQGLNEQLLLAWEVWGCAVGVWSRWAAFTTKENAERLREQLSDEIQLMRFEVRHNTKQDSKSVTD